PRTRSSSRVSSYYRRQGAGANLYLHLRHELKRGQHYLLVPHTPRAHRGAPRLSLALPHHGHVGDLLQLAVADPVVEGLVTLVEMRADARGAQPLVQRACRRRLRVRDGQDADLLGSEPERKRPRELLDQESHEPL